MSNNHEIEATKEQLQQSVALRDSLHRLLQNPDFKALVTEGYIRDETLRTSKLLGDPSVRASEKTYNAVIDEIKAIALFDNHLRAVENIGNQAAQYLEEYEAAEASGELSDEDE